jgi:hypothetical protein
MTFGIGDACVLLSISFLVIIMIDLLIPPGPKKL